MGIEVSTEGRQMTIRVVGDFENEDIPKFQLAYRSALAQSVYVIDMEGIEYIDSIFLGQVAAMRKHVGDASISIINTSTLVNKQLKVVKFDKYVDVY